MMFSFHGRISTTPGFKNGIQTTWHWLLIYHVAVLKFRVSWDHKYIDSFHMLVNVNFCLHQLFWVNFFLRWCEFNTVKYASFTHTNSKPYGIAARSPWERQTWFLSPKRGCFHERGLGLVNVVWSTWFSLYSSTSDHGVWLNYILCLVSPILFVLRHTHCKLPM